MEKIKVPQSTWKYIVNIVNIVNIDTSHIKSWSSSCQLKTCSKVVMTSCSQRIACYCKRVDLAKTQKLANLQMRNDFHLTAAVCLKVQWLNSAVLYSGRNKGRLSPNSETTCGSPWAQMGACSQSLKCLQIFTGLCWALGRRCWLLLSKLHCRTAKPDSHAVLQLHITFVRLSACIRPVGTQCIWLGLRICCTLLTLIIDLFSDRDGFSATNES